MNLVPTSCATCGQPIRLAYMRGNTRTERPVPVQATAVPAIIPPGLGDAWDVRTSHPIHAPYCGVQARNIYRRTRRRTPINDQEPLVAILHAINTIEIEGAA